MSGFEAVTQNEVVRAQQLIVALQNSVAALRTEVGTLQNSVNGVRAVSDAANNNASLAAANANAANTSIVNKPTLRRVQRGVSSDTDQSNGFTVAISPVADVNRTEVRLLGANGVSIRVFLQNQSTLSFQKDGWVYVVVAWEVSETY